MLVGCNPVTSWERRARRLTREGERTLRRLQTESHGAALSSGLSTRMEVLMAEKHAAYETPDMERYEAAIRAMVHQAGAIQHRS
jgi:hypothetical protein